MLFEKEILVIHSALVQTKLCFFLRDILDNNIERTSPFHPGLSVIKLHSPKVSAEYSTTMLKIGQTLQKRQAVKRSERL